MVTNICDPSHFFNLVTYTSTGAPAGKYLKFVDASYPLGLFTYRIDVIES